MQIDIRDSDGRPRLTVHVDPANPPTIVRADDGRGAPVSLSWDRAMDDAGFLRQCPVCGCMELYRDVKFPRLTPFVVLLAITAAFLWWQNVYTWPWAVLSLGIVAVADVLLWFTTSRAGVLSLRHDVPRGPGPAEAPALGRRDRRTLYPPAPTRPRATYRQSPARNPAMSEAPHTTNNPPAPGTPLVIYGAGGHGTVVADAATLAGYRVVGFLDDREQNALAPAELLLSQNDPALAGTNFIPAIGDNTARAAVMHKIEQLGGTVVNVVHPAAAVSPTAKLGHGVYVAPQAVVNAHAVVGNGCIINSAAVVEHHCTLGDFAHLAPGAVIGEP